MPHLPFRKYAKHLPRPVKAMLLSVYHTIRDVPGGLFDLLGRPRSAWRTRLPTELAFWDEYLNTGNSAWQEDFHRRTTPNWPFQEFLTRLISVENDAAEIRVLDVGAGPLTQLGSSWPGKLLHITAIDPLADAYGELLRNTPAFRSAAATRASVPGSLVSPPATGGLLRKYRIVPPVPTLSCEAERLVERFGESSFDLVYAQNCLDHSYDPLLAIRQAVAVVKPGCYVYLRHEQNEAIKERGRGLHKWNFRAVGGDFVIERAEHTANVTSELAHSADLSCSVDDEDFLVVLLRKHQQK